MSSTGVGRSYAPAEAIVIIGKIAVAFPRRGTGLRHFARLAAAGPRAARRSATAARNTRLRQPNRGLGRGVGGVVINGCGAAGRGSAGPGRPVRSRLAALVSQARRACARSRKS